MNFHPIGFFVPFTLSAMFAFRALTESTWLDFALLTVATMVSYLGLSKNNQAIHMVESYAFVVLFYAWRTTKTQPIQVRPTCLIMVFFFISMAVPDVIGAHLLSNGRNAIVGGAGLYDGLFVWPIGGGFVYLMLCSLELFPRLNGGIAPPSLQVFLKHHFHPCRNN